MFYPRQNVSTALDKCSSEPTVSIFLLRYIFYTKIAYGPCNNAIKTQVAQVVTQCNADAIVTITCPTTIFYI